MKRTAWLVLVFLAGWSGSFAAPAGGVTTPAGGVVTVGEIPTATVHPGDSTSVVIPVEIARGYHVQANPPSHDYLVPLELELDSSDPGDFLSWRTVYPEPGFFRLAGAEDEWLTYQGSIGIELIITSTVPVRPGKRILAGVLKYQACDQQRCLFPASIPVKLAVVIPAGDGGAAGRRR